MLSRLAAAGVAVAVTLAATGPVAAATRLEGVPAYNHVGILVLENESFGSTWGPASPAAYLNSLVPRGAFADMYYATGHVSLDNYVAMTSGQPWEPGTGSDCMAENLYTCAQTQALMNNGANIADQAEQAGRSWKGYMDSMPSPCFHGDASPSAAPPDPYQGDGGGDAAYRGNYADRHNPFNYYPDILGNAARCQGHVVPYGQLSADIAANTVPNFFFITPDTCHDGHDTPCAAGSTVPACPGRDASSGGLVSADCWLHASLPPILRYLNSHNGILFLTFDEGANNDLSGCCTGGPGGGAGFGGRVGLLALGHGVATGTTTHTAYDHASLLRTTEDALGVSTHLNNAAAATAMSDLFRARPPRLDALPLVALASAGAAAVPARRRRVAQR